MNRKDKQFCNLMLNVFALKSNDQNSGALSDELVEKCGKILDVLPVMPAINPTDANSVLMEFERSDGAYLEFEVFENVVIMFKVDENRQDEVKRLYDIQDIAIEAKRFNRFARRCANER